MMATKSERRSSYENRVEQDGRLAGKHIKTLLHLQDLHSENDLLKARIAELEVQQAKSARCDLLEREVEKMRGDLSKCQELHEIAKDSKEKLQQMQQDCLMKIDETCAILTENHKAEVMRIVSEKLEAENSWVLEKQELTGRNGVLTRENRLLKEELESLRTTRNETVKLNSALQEAKVTIDSLKGNSEQLTREKAVLEKAVRDFSTENESLSTEVDKLKSRIAVLEMQSKLAQASKAEEQDQAAEIAKFRELIKELEEKNETLTQEVDKLDKDNKVLDFNIQDSARALKNMYKERDLLKNRITGLLNEITALRSQTPEKHTFVDFVHLKRDYNALKDEHEKLLKKRSSKSNALPTLKSDTIVGRIPSGGSVRSGVGGVGASR